MVHVTRRVLSLLLVLGIFGVPAAFAQAPSVVHAFDGVVAGTPAAGLTLGGDGFLYGTTEAPASQGAVFRVRPNGTDFQILHVFARQAGVMPSHGALARGLGGVFYGTTLQGGAADRGTVYRLDTGPFGATVTTLHEFAAADANPDGGVILASDGLLYGTFGDDVVSATVYRLATDGTGFEHLRVLPNGYRPTGTLLEGSDGLLYGTTERGGLNDGGTVFRLNRDGTAFATLVELEGNPVSGLTEAPGSDGTPHLFGVETTGQNAVTQFGAIFQLRRDGAAFVRLSAFTASDADGDTPRSPLLLGRDGALYGTTTSENIACPPENCGTVFRVTPSGRPFSLFTFPRIAGGAPMGALVQGPDGTLYGTARVGGPAATAPGTGHGVVFAVPAPDRVPLELTGPAISDEGGEAAYSLTLRNSTNHTLAGPITVAVTPSPGLVFTDQSADGWSCTQPQAVGLLCVWSTELPAAFDSDAHTLRFTLAPPFSTTCGTGPSPCVSLLATVYDYGAAASVTTTARALVGGTLNTPPVPQDDTVPVYGTATAMIRVLDNDLDPDGDALRVTRLLEFPRFGDATINADGTITYTPADTLLQPDTFRYEVSDDRMPSAATASALVTLTPSIPPLTASRTRLDLGPLAPRRIATGRFSLRSPVAMEVRIELQPATAADIAAALQGTAYDPAQAVSDPDAFRSDGRLSIDPLYSSAFVVGVHYQAPLSVGRVSVAKVQIIGEPPGLAPVTRSLLIVASSADPATAPPRAVDDTTATPVQTSLWYDVLANDGGVSIDGRPLYVSSVGCMHAFPDTDCFVPANMAATQTLPASISGPQEVGFGTSTAVTGTATVMYSVSELDACVGTTSSGACYLEGNMYYGYLSVDVGGTPPDLALTIAPATQTVAPGDVVTLTATVTNQGPGMASRVTVSGFADLTRLDALVVTTSQGTCATPAPGGPLTCTLRNLLQGATATITIQGTAEATLIPAGETEITLDGTASVSFGNADSQPGNNSAQARVTLTQPGSTERADLSVSLTVTPATVLVGEPVTITATVTNQGPDAATAVTLTGFDFIVDTHTIDSVVASQGNCGAIVAPQPLQCGIGTLASGASATVVIVARPTDAVFGGNQTAQVSVGVRFQATADQQDVVPANNQAYRAFDVRRAQADVSVSATATPAMVLVGEPVTITATVTNDGPDAASGVTLTGLDYVLATHTIDSVVASQGSCGAVVAPQPLQCGIGTLASGASATVVIVARPTDAVFGGNQTAQVSVGVRFQATADQQDVVPANNQAYRAFDVRRAQADLAVTVAGTAGTIEAGQPITFTAVITNAGTSPASNVTFLGFSPMATFPSFAFAASRGNCAPTTPATPGVVDGLSCELGTLLPGEAVTVVVSSVVPATLFSTTPGNSLLLNLYGWASSSEEAEGDNNGFFVGLGVTRPLPLLGATLSSDFWPGFAVVGGPVLVNGTVTNLTDQAAANPTARFVFPEEMGVTAQLLIPAGWTCSPTPALVRGPAGTPGVTMDCGGSSLAARTSVYFRFEARALSAPEAGVIETRLVAASPALSQLFGRPMSCAPEPWAGTPACTEATAQTPIAPSSTAYIGHASGAALALSASAGQFRVAQGTPLAALPSAPPPPEGVSFPYGVISFELVDVPVGEAVTVQIFGSAPVSGYWKLQGNTWEPFSTAESNPTFIAITLVDGGPGDEDGVANGVIVDPGALGVILDTTPPTVTIDAPTAGAAYVLNQVVNASYSCTDAVGVATCQGPVPTGEALDTSTVGPKTFTVTATDAAGNQSQVVRHYSVALPTVTTCRGEPSRQILAPINADGSSRFVAGLPVLARFRVCGPGGQSLGTPGLVTSFRLVRSTTAAGAVVAADAPVPTFFGPSTIVWNPLTQSWLTLIDTRRIARKATHTFRITLNDGSTIDFTFFVG